MSKSTLRRLAIQIPHNELPEFLAATFDVDVLRQALYIKTGESTNKLTALLQFAINNENRFTEHDPDDIKHQWIEESKKVLKGI